MNRRPPGSKSPSRRAKALSSGKAIEGSLQFTTAEGLSPRTVETYHRDLLLWLEIAREIEISQSNTPDVTHYPTYLETVHFPRQITWNNEKNLSPKTLRIISMSLSAGFRWVSRVASSLSLISLSFPLER